MKEKSASFSVTPAGYAGRSSLGSSAIMSSGGTTFVQSVEPQPKLTITESDLKSDGVKRLVVRFPHGEVREHEVRFYYVKVRNDGGKTADDMIDMCGSNQMRFIPLTGKSTFGLDFEGTETLEEFDKFGIESFVVALLRDHRKLKDAMEYASGPSRRVFCSLLHAERL